MTPTGSLLPRPGPIYHLALSDEWEAAVAEGTPYCRSTLGKSLEQQGFIHCSFRDQVETIANLIYRGRSDVVLLTIDTSKLQAEVRVENLEGGTNKFPHVYGPSRLTRSRWVMTIGSLSSVTSPGVDSSGHDDQRVPPKGPALRPPIALIF